MKLCPKTKEGKRSTLFSVFFSLNKRSMTSLGYLRRESARQKIWNATIGRITYNRRKTPVIIRECNDEVWF
jgi:hypothetical protein